MGKEKSMFKRITGILKPKCKHKYKFATQMMNALTVRNIRGVCVNCGEQIEMELGEYRKFLEEHKDSVVGDCECCSKESEI